jgi:hypothetical protein
MADSVRLVIHVPRSLKADSVRWNRRRIAELEFKLASRIWASWKAAAPIIEIFVFLLFALVAVVAVVGCFVELIRLLDSDALGHVAAKALQGGS